MTELGWFFLIGGLAVGFAIAMLLSDNPVHSALFLIGTMGCVAFLFLLLNAAFLAMIQITVYTGAIMVLFLFVIMLLGAETLHETETSPDSPRFGWYRPLALGLVAALLLIVGIVLINVNLNLQTDTGAQPQVRVLNVAPDAGTVDVYANDQLIASAVPFREPSAYIPLAAGDYTIKIQPATGVAVTTTVSLAKGTQQTLVDYSSNRTLNVGVVSDDNSTVTEDRSARLVVFNGFADVAALNLVDLGSDLNINNAHVIVSGLKPGQTSDALVEPEGTVNWALVDAANPQNVLYRLDNYAINRDTSGLIVMTQERVFDGAQGGRLRPLALPVVADSAPAFGGPRAIGLQLFTNDVLVFQLLAVLLLAAMVGAIVLTHRQTVSATRKVGGRRRVSRPLVNVIASQVGHDVTNSGEGAPELQEPTANGAPVGK